jgi:hypothetical protein
MEERVRQALALPMAAPRKSAVRQNSSALELWKAIILAVGSRLRRPKEATSHRSGACLSARSKNTVEVG